MSEQRSTRTRRLEKQGLRCVRVGSRTYWVPVKIAERIERIAQKERRDEGRSEA